MHVALILLAGLSLGLCIRNMLDGYAIKHRRYDFYSKNPTSLIERGQLQLTIAIILFFFFH